ncbi:MAG: T9SS type A sorting domain-containing protein, partial [Ignavibacteriota bacterium]
RVALVRYLSDGSLDRSFGDTGVVFTAIHDSDDCAKSVQVQKDGKIVVAGFTLENPHGFYHPVVLRYNPNGTLDSSFGNFGIAETIVGSGDAKANGMVIQSDRKIVIAGYSSSGKDDDFLVACYDPNGSLDKKFGNGGITTTDYGFGDDHCNAVALQSDGGIVVAGYAFNGKDNDYAVARYLPDLSLGVIDRKTTQTISTIYPNPIHASARLVYELLEQEPVTMKLCDVTGRSVLTLLDHQNRQAGKNEEQIVFPSELPPSSYYLTIEAGKEKTTVKIIKE